MANSPLVGVGVIVTQGDSVLLLRRKNVHGAGTWSTPGGHLEYGESPEACAVREVQEETGVDIADLQFMGITSDVFEEYGRHYITIWMRGKHVAGEPFVNDASEMSKVGWFSWDDLPAPLFLPLRQLLDGKCYRTSENDSVTDKILFAGSDRVVLPHE